MPEKSKTQSNKKGILEHAIFGVKDSTKPFSGLQYILLTLLCVWAVVRLQTMVNYVSLGLFLAIFSLAGAIAYSAVLLLFATLKRMVVVNWSYMIANLIIFTLFIILVADTLNQSFPVKREEPVGGKVYEMKAEQDDWLHWVYIKSGGKNYKVSLHRYRYNKVSLGDIAGIELRTGLLGFDYLVFVTMPK